MIKDNDNVDDGNEKNDNVNNDDDDRDNLDSDGNHDVNECHFRCHYYRRDATN